MSIILVVSAAFFISVLVALSPLTTTTTSSTTADAFVVRVWPTKMNNKMRQFGASPVIPLEATKKGRGGKSPGEEDYNPNDPRAFRKRKKKEQQAAARRRIREAEEEEEDNKKKQQQKQRQKRRQAILEKINKRKQGEAASLAMDIPEQPLISTIGGGTAMIFAMARRMAMDNAASAATDSEASSSSSIITSSRSSSTNSNVGLPRYRPTPGISDVNPQFRYKSPVMTNQGYAGQIWRNVRKRKPSMWRYALNTYDRMEEQQSQSKSQSSSLRVERTNVHHEGALVACAKLGMWEKALEIYRSVIEQEKKTGAGGRKPTVQLTDNMVMSVIRACVRGARQRQQKESSPGGGEGKTFLSLEERRAPLDAAKSVLQDITSHRRDSLPLVSHHVNPVSAAFQSLGLHKECSDLIQSLLTDRNSGCPEDEDGTDRFSVNVNNLSSKDKASYGLQVQGAVYDADYSQAVDKLREMTEAGLYPNARHLNRWTEVSERKTKNRTTRSWTKKREEYWLESVR